MAPDLDLSPIPLSSSARCRLQSRKNGISADRLEETGGGVAATEVRGEEPTEKTDKEVRVISGEPGQVLFWKSKGGS